MEKELHGEFQGHYCESDSNEEAGLVDPVVYYGTCIVSVILQLGHDEESLDDANLPENRWVLV